MSKKHKRRLRKFQEKEMERMRRVAKVVDDYCYNKMDAKECMKRITEIVYQT